MYRPRRLALGAAVALGTAALAAAVPAAGAAANDHANIRAVCPTPGPDDFHCNAWVKADSRGKPTVTSAPVGYGPLQFHTAYQVPTTAAAPTTIGVVDAYGNPNLRSDLDVYDQAMGLPAFPNCSSTVTTACLQLIKPKQKLSSDAAWALETDMDVQTVHQMCQNCRIVQVSTQGSWSALMSGVDQAVQQGANVVSLSLAGAEFSTQTSYDSHFNVPGVAFVVSSGDGGYGPQWPASSPYVTAVGGTTLALNPDNTRASETVWSKAGSGCSAYEPKPAFQTDTGCATRTVADVAADADPNTGAAVYDTVAVNGKTGWFQEGGTSLSAPLIAGVYALSGNFGSAAAPANSLPYANSGSLYDVLAGSNGTCSPIYLCTGGTGYDGPSGLGTPNGTAAF